MAWLLSLRWCLSTPRLTYRWSLLCVCSQAVLARKPFERNRRGSAGKPCRFQDPRLLGQKGAHVMQGGFGCPQGVPAGISTSGTRSVVPKGSIFMTTPSPSRGTKSPKPTEPIKAAMMLKPMIQRGRWVQGIKMAWNARQLPASAMPIAESPWEAPAGATSLGFSASQR